MAESRTITKELAGLEDILTGEGTVNQTRGGVTLPISKINAGNLAYDATKTIKAVLDAKVATLDNVAAMQAFVTTLGKEEFVYLQGYAVSGDSGGGLFWLDPSDTTSTEDLISIFNPDVLANGRWKRLDLGDSMSADNGDANVTLTTVDEVIQLFDTVFTTNRTVTLPTLNLFKGLRYKIIYTTASAFTLAIGSLYTFAAGDSGSIEIQYDGTDWEILNIYTTKPKQYFATAGGTVDAMTLAVGIAAYVEGDLYTTRSLGNNTITTPTINVDGKGLKTIVKEGNAALLTGDMGPVGRELFLRYNGSNDNVELVNPPSSAGGLVIKDWGILSVSTPIDMSDADLHLIEIGANITLTFSSSNTTDRATFAIQNGGGYTITPAGIDNNSPTFTVGTNVQDIMGLVKTHGKITLVGFMDNQSSL